MNVFVIGAGFTKAAFPKAPLNSELLNELAIKSTNSAAAALLDKYNVNDIEIALTRLDSDIAQSESTDEKKLRSEIETELGNFFSAFLVSDSFLVKLPWLTQFIDGIVKAGDVVISLNYDCVLEGALDCRGKWSPNGGYGCLRQPNVGDEEFSKSPVTVLKIHGSASFVIAPIWDKPEASAVSFIFDHTFFPNSAKNTSYGYGAGMGRPYVIAPSYVKIPTVDMTRLMLDALNASTTATNLLIIGSAIRPEDGFLKMVLVNFFRQNNWKAREIFIVDPHANEIGRRLRNELWHVGKNQIVPIEGCLEHSITLLMESLSK